MNGYKAVLFDVGGVLVPSPLVIMNVQEELIGLPKGFITSAIASVKEIRDLWSRWECNKIEYSEFCNKMDYEFTKHIQTTLATEQKAQLKKSFEMRKLVEGLEVFDHSQINNKLIKCAELLRERGLKVCIISNNWYSDVQNSTFDNLFESFKTQFDHIIESRLLGLNKPHPKIYEEALRLLGDGIKPKECIFLDDLGPNLKAAKRLGIFTIKVLNEDQAIKDLEDALGFKLAPSSKL
ncbi:hypothetical protein AKO1_012554 [Acrasis kona]|uniref:Epoxide hydrolase n=1 Tax=Acrasis kona TaxID=1008807 RepID=A0AAW2YX27_9EUKA